MTPFEKRLYTGFGILVVLFTPILVGAFFVISQLEVTQGDLLSKNAQDVIAAERLSSLMHEEMGLVQGYVLRGDENSIKQLESVHRDFQTTVSSLLLNLDVEEDPALLNEVRNLEKEGYGLLHEAVSMRRSGASIEKLNAYFESNNPMRGRRGLLLVDQNVKVQNDQLHEARAYANRVAKRLVIGLISACGFALLATAGIVLLLWQMIRNKAREDRERDERYKLELKLSSARKEAVEVVAHDLKNPLSALKMSHELLRDELVGEIARNGEVAMGFQIAERSIQSMQRLIDDQLDHTKIEAGQLALDKKIANVADVIRDLEVRYRPLMEAKGLSFVSTSERALFAEIDSVRIDQLISNLLGNAMKFTPPGGLVQLIAKRVGPKISILVKDNGPGISSESREHIFERYWQVKETAKKGTGLGLSIAQGIADAHGGKLSCRSEVGRGSEFELVLSAVDIGPRLHVQGPEVAQ